MEEVAVAKKRGRPAKVPTAPTSGSPVDTIPALPKKRGRPTKAKGRGRPAKLKVSSDNDDIDNEELGDAELQTVPSKAAGAGKGRGRPRKPVAPAPENSGSDDEEGDSSADDKPQSKTQKSPPSVKRRKLGRPKKHEASDNEEDEIEYDDDAERRPLGRPNTGATKLNIVRTGRGQGRPKGSKTSVASLPKKRGRPALNNKTAAAYVPSGRPRGRPKANAESAGDDDEGHQPDDSDEKADDPDDTSSTPKKRGRPSLKSGSSPGARGRSKSQKSPKVQNNEDDEFESGAEMGEEANGNMPKKRGRISKSTKSEDSNGSDSFTSDDKEDILNSTDASETAKKRALKRQTLTKNGEGDAKGDVDADDAEVETNESIECISDEPL